MPTNIILGTNSAGNEPSPAIWDRVPMSDVFHGKMKLFYDDFGSLAIPLAVTSNAAVYTSDKGWYSYQDTGDTIAQLATDDNGVLAISVAATNNNESWLSAGSAASVYFTPRTKANDGKSIFFEARVQMSTLVGNMFIGLAEEATGAANAQADSGGTMVDKDFIGFHVDEDAPTTPVFKYNKASSGATNGTAVATLSAMVADTWIKLGFIVDMEEWDAAKRIKYFVDGIEQPTAVTNTAYINTTLFPTGEELHVLFGGKNNNAAKVLRIDWVRVAQLKGGN